MKSPYFTPEDFIVLDDTFEIGTASIIANAANLKVAPLLEELALYKKREARRTCYSCGEQSLTHDGIALLDELIRIKEKLERTKEHFRDSRTAEEVVNQQVWDELYEQFEALKKENEQLKADICNIWTLSSFDWD